MNNIYVWCNSPRSSQKCRLSLILLISNSAEFSTVYWMPVIMSAIVCDRFLSIAPLLEPLRAVDEAPMRVLWSIRAKWSILLHRKVQLSQNDIMRFSSWNSISNFMKDFQRFRDAKLAENPLTLTELGFIYKSVTIGFNSGNISSSTC